MVATMSTFRVRVRGRKLAICDVLLVVYLQRTGGCEELESFLSHFLEQCLNCVVFMIAILDELCLQ